MLLERLVQVEDKSDEITVVIPQLFQHLIGQTNDTTPNLPMYYLYHVNEKLGQWVNDELTAKEMYAVIHPLVL